MMKPIPAFYCCYLLRSTVRHQATYVGSTPNPVRRLKQHNGEAPGGAVRTSSLSLRPWEMTCIVSGFPSKVAALQFEWAWQNTHLTRHIPTADRITAARTTVRVSPRTGKVRKRSTRPRMSLTDRLSNLHLLLRVKSFDRWPLRLTFFNEEVHRIWEKWLTQTPFRLRHGIVVQLEKRDIPKAFQRPETESTLEDMCDWIGKGLGIQGIDIGHAPMKAYLDKSIQKLKRSEPMDCTVCKTRLSPAKSLLVVCPTQGCQMVSHVTCLSRKFLGEEGKAAAIVPLQGECPSCQETLQWSTLMRDLSLRSSGEKEVAKLFRKGKSKEVEEEEDEDTEQDLSDGFADVDDWCDAEETDKSASKQRKAKSPTKARVGKTNCRPKTKKAAKYTSQKGDPSDDSWADAEILD